MKSKHRLKIGAAEAALKGCSRLVQPLVRRRLRYLDGRHYLFQFGVLDPIGDLLGNRMRERPARPRALRVEIGSDRLLAVEELLARTVRDSILKVARLATGAQANDKTLRSVSRAPSCDFCIEGIDRALRCRGGFRDDVEFLAEHDLELRDQLCL